MLNYKPRTEITKINFIHFLSQTFIVLKEYMHTENTILKRISGFLTFFFSYDLSFDLATYISIKCIQLDKKT